MPAEPQNGDAIELSELKRTIREQIGLDCDAYKEPCLRRRIGVRMRARGLHRYTDYGALLREDQAERERLLDAITINVSKFFRNPEVWELLEQRVIPQLFTLKVPRIRIWSAGCAGGEEPYTIAMALLQYARDNGCEAQLRKFDVLATDVDPHVLELARRGEYASFAFTDINPATRAVFFDQGTRLKAEVKRMVRFAQLDLMTDPFPGHQHLVVCRNVIIYFERSVQERLFRQFHAALVPGGFLVLGKVETLFGAAAALFKTIAARERVFCRT